MNFALTFIILSLAILHCSVSADNVRCNRACTREYNPVCGTLVRRDGKLVRCTFANTCLLNLRRCLTKENWSAIRGRCPRDSLECRRITTRN